MAAIISNAKVEIDIEWGEYPYRPPSRKAIQASASWIDDRLATGQRASKEISVLNRIKSGLNILDAIAAPDVIQVSAQDLATAFGKWDDIKSRLVRNSYSNFLHFLPSDDQGAEFFGLRYHSLAMFRYPITVPIEVLDLAANTSATTWANIVDSNVGAVPFLEHYRTVLPIKMLRLKSEFLADLLSRYVTVYNRIGSPDFTDASIERMSAEVDG